MPAAFVLLDALPVGSTGKLDRKLLPVPAAAAREGDADGYAAPSTPAERALAALWESVLQLSPVGVDDDFFALGGHSMLAVRLMTQVRRRAGRGAARFPPSSSAPRSAGWPHCWTRRRSGGRVVAPGGHPAARRPRFPFSSCTPSAGRCCATPTWPASWGRTSRSTGCRPPTWPEVGEETETIEAMAAALRGGRPRGAPARARTCWADGRSAGSWRSRWPSSSAAAGEAVPVVAMLDTVSPANAQRVADVDEAEVLAGLAHEEALKAGRALALTVDELRPLDREGRVRRTMGALRHAGVVAGEVDTEWVVRLLTGHRARNEAMARYEAGVYPGRLVLFRPSESLAALDPSRADWSDPAGWRPHTAQPLRVETVPGHHSTIAYGAQAAVLAGRLREVLDEALSSGGPAPAGPPDLSS